MSLPTVEQPRYALTLPSGIEIKYRPFTVKEENILLLAKEHDDNEKVIEAIKQIVENCTFTDKNPDDFTSFDLEYLFVNIRAKSVGENLDLRIKCDDCENYCGVQVGLDEVEVERHEGHTTTIQLSDTIGIQMKYPTLGMMQKILREQSGESESQQSARESYKPLIACMDSIYTEDELYPIKEQSEEEVLTWIESLTSSQRNAIVEFFNTIPSLKLELDYTCKTCDETKHKTLRGLNNFFI